MHGPSVNRLRARPVDKTLTRVSGACRKRGFVRASRAARVAPVQRGMPGMPPMRFIIFIRPPPFIFFIMPCICSNWFSMRLTSCTCTPAPAAMRRLRLALMRSGLRRSSGGHRADDAFHAAHVALGAVHVGAGGLGGELARQLVHQPGQAAHLLHLARSARGSRSGRSRSPALTFVGELLRGVDVDAFLHLFDERDDVAHAEHAPGVAFGVEDLEAVDLLATRRRT